MRWMAVTFILFGILTPCSWSGEAPPRSLDARIKIENDSALRLALVDLNSEVKRLAMPWVAEEGFTGLRDHVRGVQKLCTQPVRHKPDWLFTVWWWG